MGFLMVTVNDTGDISINFYQRSNEIMTLLVDMEDFMIVQFS